MSKAAAKRNVYKINVAPKQWAVINQGNQMAATDYWSACAMVREIREELVNPRY